MNDLKKLKKGDMMNELGIQLILIVSGTIGFGGSLIFILSMLTYKTEQEKLISLFKKYNETGMRSYFLTGMIDYCKNITLR